MISRSSERLLNEWHRVIDDVIEPSVLRAGWRASKALALEARVEEKEEVDSRVLTIRRQLVERLGETPESLRDLSVSLDNVAGTQQAQGDWSGAQSLYDEGLRISEVLASALPNIPAYAELPGHFSMRLRELFNGF